MSRAFSGTLTLTLWLLTLLVILVGILFHWQHEWIAWSIVGVWALGYGVKSFWQEIFYNIEKWIDVIPYQNAVGQLAEVNEKDPSVIYWLSDYFLVFHANGTKSEYLHQIVTLPNTLRVNEYEIAAILNPFGVAITHNIRAMLYNADGVQKKVKLTRLAPFPCETPNGIQMYHGHSVEFSNLAAGDTAELLYTRHFLQSPPQGKFNWDVIFINYQLNYCVRRRITIAISKKSPSQVVAYNFNARPVEWDRGNYHYYQWDIAHLPSYKEEFAQPPVRDSQPWIDVSTCPGWDPISKWLCKHLIHPVKSKKKLCAVLEQILAQEMHRLGKKQEELTLWEKAKACYDYCVNQITYGRESELKVAANAQAGDRVAKVMRGDCKDQTSLLTALFQELGIASELAVVNVEDGAKTRFLPSQRFDHVVLRCHIGEQCLWIDPIAKHVVFGSVSPELEGCSALLIYPDKPSEWVEIPRTPKEHNQSIYQAKAYFEEDDLKVDIDIRYAGRFSTVLRMRTLYNPKFVEENLGKVFNERLGACNVDGCELHHGWKNQDPFHITARLTAPGWLKHISNLHLLKLPWLGGYLSILTVIEQKHKTDYILPGTEHVECHVDIVIPKCYRLEKVPENKVFTTYRHRMEINFQEKTELVQMNISLDVDCDCIPSRLYGEYRNFVYAINKFFEEPMLLKLID